MPRGTGLITQEFEEIDTHMVFEQCTLLDGPYQNQQYARNDHCAHVPTARAGHKAGAAIVVFVAGDGHDAAATRNTSMSYCFLQLKNDKCNMKQLGRIKKKGRKRIQITSKSFNQRNPLLSRTHIEDEASTVSSFCPFPRPLLNHKLRRHACVSLILHTIGRWVMDCAAHMQLTHIHTHNSWGRVAAGSDEQRSGLIRARLTRAPLTQSVGE